MPAFLGEMLVNYASNMIHIRLNLCTIFWKQRTFLHDLDKFAKARLQKLYCNTQVYPHFFFFFLQTKTLVKIEKRSCYANGFSNCSSTPSEISFHGLPSKRKRPSIRKQVVVIMSVNIIIDFTKQPSAGRCFSTHFR